MLNQTPFGWTRGLFVRLDPQLHIRFTCLCPPSGLRTTKGFATWHLKAYKHIID